MPKPPPDDATAEQIAAALVRAYCGWVIAPSETLTLTLDGTSSTLLQLPTLKLTALDALSIDGTAIDLAAEDVQWSAAGFVYRAAGFGAKLRGVVVDFTHGYVEVPLDVQLVYDRIVARVTQPIGELVQVGQVRYATDADGLPVGGSLTSVEQNVLDRYKLPPRP